MKAIVLIWLFFCNAALAVESRQLLPHTQLSLEHPGLTQREWQWIYSKKALRYAAWKPVLPPFALIPGHQDYSGIVADYLGIIAFNLRLPVTVTLYENREEAIRALQLGTADIIGFAGQDTPFSHLTLSQPWSSSLPVLVSRGRNAMSSGAVLRIGVDQDNSDTENDKKRFPAARFVPFNYTREALEALMYGNIDLYLGNRIATEYLINQENLKDLDMQVRDGVSARTFSFAALPEQRNWIAIINKILTQIPPATQAEIQRRWRGGSAFSDRKELSPLLSQLEQQWLNQHHKVTVSVLDNNFPLSYTDQHGQFKGIIADLLTTVQKRSGLEFLVRREKNFSDAFTSLRTDESQVLAGASFYSAQQQSLLASRTFFYSSRALVIRRDVASDARPQRLAYLYGEQPEEKLRQYYPDSHLIAVKSWQQGLDTIVRGEADAMLMPLVTARPFITGRYAQQLRLVQGAWHEPLRLVLATSGKQYMLASILDKTLMSLPPEEMNAIISGTPSELPAVASPPDLPLWWLPILILPWLGGIGWLSYRCRIQRTALQQAQQRATQQNAFLAMLSHEIRNPVSAINGILTLLRQQETPVRSDDNTLRIAHEATESLLGLTHELLDFTRLEANRLILRPEQLSLRMLLESVASIHESTARQKNLRLLLAIDASLNEKVMADPLRLRQILNNLLGNAIKFTSAGDIRLEALCDEKPGAPLDVTLLIQDSGAGIDPVMSQHLFQPFSQGDSEGTAQGSGMGLYISRSLARMMGGDIVFQSQPGIGSTFILTLQLQRVEETDRSLHAEAAPPPAAPDPRTLRILVVDDQPANRFLLLQQLRWLGHDAIDCADVSQVASQVIHASPDLVITDCHMAPQSGFALTRNLKQRWPHLTVWGITADREKQTLDAASRSGMALCLPKPLTTGELQQHLEKFMQRTPAATLWSPGALPEALLSETHYLPFLRMQITALDEALADLACWQQHGQPPLSATLHRLYGGVALLGATQLASRCQQSHLTSEALDELINMTGRLRQELIEETTKIQDGLTAP